MDIYIKWDNDKNEIHLPVNPESFELDGSQNNTSLYIHDLGEINLKGKRGLYSIEISSFFPAQPYEFCRCTPEDPYDYYIKKLKSLYEKNTTIHLTITDTSINIFGTIESFNFGEEERNGDVRYTIQIKEFREVTSAKRTVKTPKTKSVKWKKGDTWQKITKKILGKSTKWKTVRKDNSSVISKAKKAYIKKYKKSHKGKAPKKVDEKVALIGYKVVVKL